MKIVDFGVAKLTTPTESSATLMKRTSDNLIVGTAEYISPEQAEAREVDHRSDIYALGVILFEMVTGHVPFAGSSAVEVMRKQVVEDIPRVRMLYPNIVINPGLEQVIYKALAKKADERFHSMREMELAIDHAVDEHHKQQTSLKPKQRVSVVIETLDPPSVRWGAWVAALLSVVLMGVAGWYLWQLRDKTPHPAMHNSYPNE